MDNEKKVLICIRVAELPDGPPAESYVDTCMECGRALWHAFSSPKVDLVWCADCAAKEIEQQEAKGCKAQFEPPTKEQIEEARRWRALGFPVE